METSFERGAFVSPQPTGFGRLGFRLRSTNEIPLIPLVERSGAPPGQTRINRNPCERFGFGMIKKLMENNIIEGAFGIFR